MLLYIIIGLIVLLALCILIIALARKASNVSELTSKASSEKALTSDQIKCLEDARSQLSAVRMLFSRISDSSVSKLGTEACASIDKVLCTLKEKPEKLQTSRQLFNYYLPTLEKVASRYQRIESGEVMNEAMTEKVSDYLGDVNSAMNRLYEGLYDNDKLLTEVDIEAMTMAIKRDGLLDD